MTREELLAAIQAGADLAWVDGRGADLAGADLRDADLTGAVLRDADLAGANLAGACLTGALVHCAQGIISATGIGSARRTVYAWRGPDGWTVQAGCWEGTTASLRERVARNPWRGQPEKDIALWAAQYVAFCDMVDAQ